MALVFFVNQIIRETFEEIRIIFVPQPTSGRNAPLNFNANKLRFQIYPQDLLISLWITAFAWLRQLCASGHVNKLLRKKAEN